jgi:hypothetical protein
LGEAYRKTYPKMILPSMAPYPLLPQIPAALRRFPLVSPRPVRLVFKRNIEAEDRRLQEILNSWAEKRQGTA